MNSRDTSNNPSIKGWRKGEAGSSAVEFALILPIALTLLFGFFEMGRLFMSYNIASAAVRDAGRFAARLPANCTGLTTAGDDVRVQNLARTGTVDAGGTPLLAGWTNNASIAISASCLDNTGATYSGSFEGISQIPSIQVTATAPFNSLFAGLFPGIDIGAFTVSHEQVWSQ
jgi:Flp pilus assembly protein TadG